MPTSQGTECTGFCKALSTVPGVVGIYPQGPWSSPSMSIGREAGVTRGLSCCLPCLPSPMGQSCVACPPGPITAQSMREAGSWAASAVSSGPPWDERLGQDAEHPLHTHCPAP